MSEQQQRFLPYSVRWVTNILREVAAQQKANRIKKRKLRALRAAIKDMRNELLMHRDHLRRGLTFPDQRQP